MVRQKIHPETSFQSPKKPYRVVSNNPTVSYVSVHRTSALAGRSLERYEVKWPEQSFWIECFSPTGGWQKMN